MQTTKTKAEKFLLSYQKARQRFQLCKRMLEALKQDDGADMFTADIIRRTTEDLKKAATDTGRAIYEIGEICEQLPQLEGDILRERYLHLNEKGRLQSWTTTADNLCYNVNYCIRLHRQAVAHVDAILQDTDTETQ